MEVIAYPLSQCLQRGFDVFRPERITVPHQQPRKAVLQLLQRWGKGDTVLFVLLPVTIGEQLGLQQVGAPESTNSDAPRLVQANGAVSPAIGQITPKVTWPVIEPVFSQRRSLPRIPMGEGYRSIPNRLGDVGVKAIHILRGAVDDPHHEQCGSTNDNHLELQSLLFKMLAERYENIPHALASQWTEVLYYTITRNASSICSRMETGG
ncbi:MAG: hypothetical protein JXR97_05975 [Planctomycetes bacterium]|nr:hypothetical protein [Planctomycetota bacterium]